MRCLAAIFTATFLWVTIEGAAGQTGQIEVDLELVLAVDVSNSVDLAENAVQRAGYVEAIRHPDVWAAIQAGIIGRIALTYVEWAGTEKQRVTLPWRLIDSPEAAEAAADTLAAKPIFFTRGTGTSISAALIFSAGLFDANRFAGLRHVIDISGDGPNNRGAPADVIRDALSARDITINGLPLVMRPAAGDVAVDDYYADCVIGGPGAFVMRVERAEQLAAAIRNKLVREIAATTPPQNQLVTSVQANRLTDCRPEVFFPGWPSPT